MKMKALITGLCGFVASHLARYLMRETDWHVYGTIRWNEPLDNLEGLTPFLGKRIYLIEADLNDPGSLDAALKKSVPDYVFHLAAQSYVQASFAYPAQTIQTNTIGTLNLLEAIRNNAPKALIHNCSSSEVYGRVTMEQVPINEQCAFSPSSPYSISKIGADFIGRYYHQAHGLKVLTTRSFTHTGAGRGDVFMESDFAKHIAMIEAGMMEPPIHFVYLDSVRTIIDVRDMVRAYHMLLTVNPTPGEVYNIGGDYSCRVEDVLNTLFKLCGKSYPTAYNPEKYRPIQVDLQIPDCSKFRQHTGWKPEIMFEETMMDLLRYWRGRVKRSVVIQR